MEQSIEVGDVWIAKDQPELEIEVFVISGDTVVCKLVKDWGGYVKGEIVTYTKNTLFRIYAKEVDKACFDAYQEGYRFGHSDGKKEGYESGYADCSQELYSIFGERELEIEKESYQEGYAQAYSELRAPTTERERQLQEKAWDEGYLQGEADMLETMNELSAQQAEDWNENTTADKETQDAMQEVLDKDDAVSNPKHYNSDPSGVKCIEITRHRNNNIGNVIKYLWRNGLKDGNSNIQDLEKGAWYLNDEIQRLKGLNNGLE